MPLSVALGLGCAFFWGIADFMGGIQSRRLPALSVVLWSQLASTLVLMAVLLWRAEPVPVGVVGWGALAGAAGGVALMLFYRGLALGVMSIVAPISAAGAIVPVIFALATGEVPTPLEGGGIAAAVAGVVLVSRPAKIGRDVGARARRLSVALAVGAGIGFGSFFVIVDQGTAGSTASPLLVMGGVRAGSLITLGTLALIRPPEARWPGRLLPAVSVLGMVDITATTLFAYASTTGNIGVVAVLSSQFPVVTIALARFLLNERLSIGQAAGAGLALAGVGLIAAA